MKAFIITADELRNSDIRNYNPSEWDKKINKYLEQYKDVVFYHVPKGDGYEYDRYYAEYTLSEGLRLFGTFNYSSTMSNGGFYRLDKQEITESGLGHMDIYKLAMDGKNEEAQALIQELAESKIVMLSLGKYPFEGEMVALNTSPQARDFMREQSTRFGTTFTKGF